MNFKDFKINLTDPGTWPNDIPVYGDAKEVLADINKWVDFEGHAVLNIETLFFPELERSKDGTHSAYFINLRDTNHTKYFQVFRVWYKEHQQKSNKEMDQLV